MDISDASPQRFELGIERFLEGESLAYEGIVVYRSPSGVIEVDSYSQWEPEHATEQHAKERIARAKGVVAGIAARSEAFRQEVARLPIEHLFCYDYGTGSFAIAKEVGGVLQWLR